MDAFVQKLSSYIASHRLMQPGERVLLTVSGGIDSMVMAEAMHALGLVHGIAHCNFSLRGKESDEDEQFVTAYALQKGIPFFTKRFDTHGYAAERGISIQMAARELRYDWFDELCRHEGFDLIAMAHHLDDQAETFFINLARGSGIRGLAGMPVKTGRIIRPMMFTNRTEIREYALQNRIQWREDSSNASDKYLRNKIRLHLLPLFREIYPGSGENLLRSMQRLEVAEKVFLDRLAGFKKSVAQEKAGIIRFDIEALRQQPMYEPLFTELLMEFRFHPDVIQDVLASFDAQPGKTFLSSEYRLVKDREAFILDAPAVDTGTRFYIEPGINHITDPVEMNISVFSKPEGYTPPADKTIACLDLDRLEYPLVLRRWQPGDAFQPLGMTGMKKLSDFFTDMKIAVTLKSRIWLLLSGDRIVWVMGHRIDHRFRITENTKNVCQMEVIG